MCSLLKITSGYLVCSRCLVLCCVVIFTDAQMDGYHGGDGSRAGILFYTHYEIQEVATMDLVV